jgi:hypothetical protein
MMMTIQVRQALFLLLCIPSRLLFSYITYHANAEWLLKLIAVLAAIIALGFASIYLFKWRPTGIETGSEPIYWNSVRPIHAVFYALTSYYAWNQMGHIAGGLLATDTLFGLLVFLVHHYI